jgi:hypothetical protein
MTAIWGWMALIPSWAMMAMTRFLAAMEMTA